MSSLVLKKSAGMFVKDSIVVISVILSFATGQDYCPSEYDKPEGYPNDFSGVRPTNPAPLQVGFTTSFKCPHVKEFLGKSSWLVKCEARGFYNYSFVTWPECQCPDKPVETDCGAPVTYKSRFADDPGDKPAMIVTLQLGDPTVSWKMSITTDVDLDGLNIDAKGAGMLKKGNRELELTKTQESTGSKAVVELEYEFLDGTTKPRWMHPCIKKLTCDLSSSDDDSSLIWIIIGVVAVLIVVMLVCFIVCYAIKNHNKDPIEPIQLESDMPHSYTEKF